MNPALVAVFAGALALFAAPNTGLSNEPIAAAPSASVAGAVSTAIAVKLRQDALEEMNAAAAQRRAEAESVLTRLPPPVADQTKRFGVRAGRTVSPRQTQRRLRDLDRIASRGVLTLQEYRRQRGLIMRGSPAIDTKGWRGGW